MDEKKIVNEPIPYIVFESAMARLDRIIRRLWIVIIILIVLLVGSNMAWIYYESQFEDVTTTTVTQDVDSGDGNGDAIIEDGVHINGKGETDSKNNETQDQKA